MSSRKKNKKKSLKDYSLFFLIFVVAFFTATTLILPLGNTFASYDVPLWKTLDPAGTIYKETGEVVIGDTAASGTLLLDVAGQVGATEYCDQDGGNCTAATALGSDSTNIHDADNNTIVHTEESANENIIRFDVDGAEKWRLEADGLHTDQWLGVDGNTGIGVGVFGAGNLNNTINWFEGTNNSAFGQEALYANTTGYVNTAIGIETLSDNTSGYYNSAFGGFALWNNTTGVFNTSVGGSSMLYSTTGSNNVAVGHYALREHRDGSNNTAIGKGSLGSNTTSSSNNTAVGSYAGQNATGSDNVFIGHLAGASETGSNKLYIENSSSSAPLIGGDFASDEVYLNASVGIGTSSPSVTLDINGGIATAIRTISADTTAATTDHRIFCDASAGQVSVDLPAAATLKGVEFFMKKLDATGNKCRFYSSGGESIEMTYSEAFLDTQSEMCSVISDGSAWYVMEFCQLL